MVDLAYENTRNESLAVGTANITVSRSKHTFSNEARRTMIVIRNNSDDPTKIITINFGIGQATAGNGVVLRQYESLTDTTDSGYICYQGEITAICAVAGGSLSIYER